MKDIDNWQPYKGAYPNALVDIVLKDGSMHKGASPRLGQFVTTTGLLIDGREVSQIRRSEVREVTKRLTVRRYSRGRRTAR